MKLLTASLLITAGLLPSLTYSQMVAVELEKMNVLYVGVENPIKIVIENYPCDKIVLQPMHGTISQTSDPCRYLYRIDSCSIYHEMIYAGIKLGQTTRWLDTLEYRVKKVPDPRVCIAGHWAGLLNKAVFLNAAVLARMEGFDFEGGATVITYSYEILREDILICREVDIPGSRFTEKLKSEIIKSQRGDKYVFFDVIAEMSFDKCKRQLQSSAFEIE